MEAYPLVWGVGVQGLGFRGLGRVLGFWVLATPRPKPFSSEAHTCVDSMAIDGSPLRHSFLGSREVRMCSL